MLCRQGMLAGAAEWETERITRCAITRCSSQVISIILHRLCEKPSQWLEQSTQILTILGSVQESLDNYDVLMSFVSLLTSCLVWDVQWYYDLIQN